MKQLIRFFTPFITLTKGEKSITVLLVLVVFFGGWSLTGSQYIPTPVEILGAIPRLLEKDLIREFLKSLGFCFTSMFYSFVLSLIICYLSILPIFRSFGEFLRKFRFLPSVGFSFLFMKMTDGIDQQMSWMMIWGISTWLMYSMIGIALSIGEDEIMYAKSLRLSKWQMVRELLIKGKAVEILQAFIGNFAIAWMMLAYIENISKASGGIGVVLAESNKYYYFDEVYAIQILILFTGIIIDFLLRKTLVFLLPYSK